MARALVLLAILLFAGSMALGVRRVAFHQDRELGLVTDPVTLGTAHDRILGRARLLEGQSVTFEACSTSRFPASFRDALSFEVVDVEGGAEALEAPLDAARLETVRRGPTVGCVTLGRAEHLGVTSTYGIRIRTAPSVANEVASATVVFRILARDHPGDADLLPILLGLLSALSLVVGLALGFTPAPSGGGKAPSLRPGAAAALAVSALVVGFGLPSLFPVQGSLGGLLRASVIVTAELLALGLARLAIPAERRRLRLGFERPRASRLAWATAPLVGFALHRIGGVFVAMVPSTGVAPVEAFVSFTSGFVVVSLVGVIAPVVEELFFRGLFYGLVEEASGPNAAMLASAALFALVHVPQDFGAWGPMASIAFLGLALAVLRRVTGSSLVPAAAHLTHNVLVTLVALAAHR
ncbi:MAG: type II CAAX endopeptidase family protein [Polyangiales bacterium]